MSDDFGQFGAEKLRRAKSGVKLYNQGHYWDCHEDMEDPWMEYMGDEARCVYWAIIQVATALFHVEQENLAGAIGMLGKAKDKIRRCEKARVETPVMQKLLSWKKFTDLVKAIPENPQLSDYNELAKFKFPDPDKWEPHLKD